MRKGILLFTLLLLLTSCGSSTYSTELKPGNDNIEVGSTEYTASDCIFKTEELSYVMKIDDSNIDLSKVGKYTVYYTHTYEEKEYTCERKVFVNDTTSPNVALVAGVDTIKTGAEWVDASVTYDDNYSEDLTLKVTGTVDSSTKGTYEIIYTVTDEYGNANSITRFVTVTD